MSDNADNKVNVKHVLFLRSRDFTRACLRPVPLFPQSARTRGGER